MQFQNTDAILDLSNVTTGGIKCSTTPSTLLLISTLSRNVQTQINTINTTITVLPTFHQRIVLIYHYQHLHLHRQHQHN